MNLTFQDFILRVVREKIASLKRAGTVAIGKDCLFGLVVQQLSKHPQSPKGVNGAYYARMDFNAVLENPKVRGFIL
jgi:hypothetical protein